jgi:hypothetical protein
VGHELVKVILGQASHGFIDLALAVGHSGENIIAAWLQLANGLPYRPAGAFTVKHGFLFNGRRRFFRRGLRRRRPEQGRQDQR